MASDQLSNQSPQLPATTQKFTLDESLSISWDMLKGCFWRFLGILALAGLLTLLPQFADMGVKYGIGEGVQAMLLSGLLGIASGIITILMALGTTNVQLKIVHGESFTSNDLWGASGKFWAYIGSSILFGIMVGLGTLFFVIPGIIIYLTFQFYSYFLVEYRLGPLQALTASQAITKGAKWELFFLALVLMFFRGVGYMMLLIGIVPAEMFAKLAMTKVYRMLVENTPPEELPFKLDDQQRVNLIQ